MPNDRIAPSHAASTASSPGQQVRSVVSAATARRVCFETGQLEPVRRGVYRVAGAPESWRAVTPGRMSRPPERLRVVPVGGRALGPGGLRTGRRSRSRCRDPTALGSTASSCTRARSAGPSTSASWHGIPVASVARTLCDLTAVVAAMDDRARGRRGLASQDRDARGPSRASPTTSKAEGGSAAPSCERSSSTRAPGYHPGESDPERRIAELLDRAGLPAPTLQHRVELGAPRPIASTSAIRSSRSRSSSTVWKYHSGRSAFDHDRARGNDLVLLGFHRARASRRRSSDQQIVDIGGGRARLEHPSVDRVRIRQRSDGCSWAGGVR